MIREKLSGIKRKMFEKDKSNMSNKKTILEAFCNINATSASFGFNVL